MIGPNPPSAGKKELYPFHQRHLLESWNPPADERRWRPPRWRRRWMYQRQHLHRPVSRGRRNYVDDAWRGIRDIIHLGWQTKRSEASCTAIAAGRLKFKLPSPPKQKNRHRRWEPLYGPSGRTNGVMSKVKTTYTSLGVAAFCFFLRRHISAKHVCGRTCRPVAFRLWLEEKWRVKSVNYRWSNKLIYLKCYVEKKNKVGRIF